MKKWTQDEINQAVRLHNLWLAGESEGVKAILPRADLSRAELSEADLSRAELSEANLSVAKNIKRCSVDWDGHCESGRKLSAIRIGNENRYFCGCFSGTLAELREYIAKGEEKHRASRTKVADFVASCMETT